MKRIILFALMVLLITSCGADKRVNVLLILTDTVRADHVSCYGYSKNTTPYIDSLAAAGTIAEKCQAQASWTLPAMATIMSGTSPVLHGAGRNSVGFHGVSPDVPWLPLAFSHEGYRTAAFFNVIFMNADFSFHRGFQHFDCQGISSAGSVRDAEPTVNDFLTWLDGSDTNKPFFAAVHFYDPHIPYSPPEPFRHMFTNPEYAGEYDNIWGREVADIKNVNSGETILSSADTENLIALYDGELAYMDAEIGRMLAELRSRGLAENTLVVLVGDHGEEFLEHGGVEHGRTLYQEITHVPLIIAGPGFNGGNTIPNSTSQLDIAATIADVAGIEFTAMDPALNLASLIDSSRSIPASGVLWNTNGELASVVSNNKKIIWAVDNDSLETYDLTIDSGEKEVIQSEDVLIEAVEYYWATPPMGEGPFMDYDDYSEAAFRELRNLGYVR